MDNRVYAGAVAAMMGVVALRGTPYWGTTVDDAWITARYSMQIAAGNGPVYNAAQPAVEGFTNPAWTLLMAVHHRLGIDLAFAMEAWGVLFAMVAVAGVMVLVRRWDGPPEHALGAGLVLALDPNLAIASTNGLESSMFVAWSVWVLIAVGGPSFGVGVLAALGVWIRPEGVAVGGVAVALQLLRRRDPLWKTLVPFSLGVASLWAVRWGIYGTFLPNTVSAKADGSSWKNLASNMNYFGRAWPVWVVVVLGGATGLTTTHRRWERLGVAAACLAMVVAGLRVYLWMPGGRLFLPSVALLLVLAASRPSGWVRWVLTAWVAAWCVLPFTGALKGMSRDDEVHSVRMPNPTYEVLNALAAGLPEGAWMSTRDAGVAAFAVGPSVHVAETHQRALTQPHPNGRHAAVFDYTPRNPDLIVLTTRGPKRTKPVYATDHRILKRTTEPYVYIGRVRQHHRRHYDIYLRGDHPRPGLPSEWIVNRRGPNPPRGVKKP